ncbi:MAG: glucosaminidase domain-containing protein [Candidatus Competibacteraceae bacterium]|nr:glucosaminidase domain-containing protein [Candidatus Competibacteraceae bacterium]
MKTVRLAQWALESGYGSSELAQKHYNFAGLKFGSGSIEEGRTIRWLFPLTMSRTTVKTPTATLPQGVKLQRLGVLI